jgi:hypothetical protein
LFIYCNTNVITVFSFVSYCYNLYIIYCYLPYSKLLYSRFYCVCEEREREISESFFHSTFISSYWYRYCSIPIIFSMINKSALEDVCECSPSLVEKWLIPLSSLMIYSIYTVCIRASSLPFPFLNNVNVKYGFFELIVSMIQQINIRMVEGLKEYR